MDIFYKFLETTGFSCMTFGNAMMILIGIVFITLAIRKDYEPLLLVPIGMGAIVGNIPFGEGMALSVYDEGSVLYYLYFGVSQGVYPPLIFLGIGAMTDFSTMLSNPKLVPLQTWLPDAITRMAIFRGMYRDSRCEPFFRRNGPGLRPRFAEWFATLFRVSYQSDQPDPDAKSAIQSDDRRMAFQYRNFRRGRTRPATTWSWLSR